MFMIRYRLISLPAVETLDPLVAGLVWERADGSCGFVSNEMYLSSWQSAIRETFRRGVTPFAGGCEQFISFGCALSPDRYLSGKHDDATVRAQLLPLARGMANVPETPTISANAKQ